MNVTYSDVYYQRQYSTYNLAIHNVGTKIATMCFWHESIAKRSSSEVSSCIVKYIVENLNKLQTGETKKVIDYMVRLMFRAKQQLENDCFVTLFRMY